MFIEPDVLLETFSSVRSAMFIVPDVPPLNWLAPLGAQCELS